MLLNHEQIYNLYNTHVVKDESYYKKYENIISTLTNAEKTYWKHKDCPRLFSSVEFKEWVIKYNINTGKKLFCTDSTDIELNYVNYEKCDVFPYESKQISNGNEIIGTNEENDLHSLTNSNIKNNYDMVIFNQTLEHLYNPFIAMKKIYSIVKTGGYVYTSVPTLNIRHSEPYHFWGITPMGLCALSVASGFSIKELGFWGNSLYLKKLFTTNGWPDIFDICDYTGKITNDVDFQAQTWILLKKE